MLLIARVVSTRRGHPLRCTGNWIQSWGDIGFSRRERGVGGDPTPGPIGLTSGTVAQGGIGARPVHPGQGKTRNTGEETCDRPATRATD